MEAAAEIPKSVSRVLGVAVLGGEEVQEFGCVAGGGQKKQKRVKIAGELRGAVGRSERLQSAGIWDRLGR